MNYQKNITKFWEQVKDSELVYNEKYLKAKTKLYNGKISTNFHINKMSKEDSQYIYL